MIATTIIIYKLLCQSTDFWVFTTAFKTAGAITYNHTGYTGMEITRYLLTWRLDGYCL